MSHETLKRAEKVVAAAESEPEEYGHLVEQMDQSGNVAGAFLRLNVLKQAKQINASPGVIPSGPFRVIAGDPPWPYESSSDLPYPPMDIETIKKMRVAEIVEENAILWLWTTNTHLRVAFEVIEAWGFQYRTMLTWAKDQVGTGQYLRGQSEHCLFATKGNPIFVKGKWSTLLEAKRREHGRKPDEFYELVEATCPGRKVELFSRQQRTGWESYGNDVNKFVSV
jgi:N6-adenosine-specific RNA methylase IME4